MDERLLFFQSRTSRTFFFLSEQEHRQRGILKRNSFMSAPSKGVTECVSSQSARKRNSRGPIYHLFRRFCISNAHLPSPLRRHLTSQRQQNGIGANLTFPRRQRKIGWWGFAKGQPCCWRLPATCCGAVFLIR